ncbi:MAG: T9SS type A sorting domain-containing protein [Flavobacteriales bacterium]|nr:T9SS type A sorting domain-containing protein [Flavobacteriales bacterium]
MKKFTFSVLIAFLLSYTAIGQTYPTPYNLALLGNYSMTDWASTSTAGTYPTSMVFHKLSQVNPNLSSTEVGNITGSYSLSTKTRMNGLGAGGFSFTNSNTTPDNTGYQTNRGGHAILAVNTTDRTNVQVSWTAGCTNVQIRKYAIRAQYRIGTSGSWTDVISGGGEYSSVSGVGSTNFGPVTLPASCDNQSVVQIRWVYYFVSGASTNASTLFVDDISVTSIPLVTFSPLSSVCINTPSFVLSDGQPIGGVYSGPGVVGNTFDPAVAGAGTHTLTYTYTDGNGISNFATSNITVSSSACVPTTALTTASCGAVNLSMSSYIYCDNVYQAQDYEFEFTNSGLGYSQNRVRGQAVPSIGLSAVPGLLYGQTYNVRVRAKVGGVWGDFSGICSISLQAVAPTTQLTPTFCGASGISTNSSISCNSIAGADNYEFTLTNTSLGYSQVKYRGQGLPNISLSAFSGLIYGTTYDVSVRAYINGAWTDPGATCQITLNGGVPTTTLDGASCGATGLSRSTGTITCTSVASAVNYQWRFYNGNTLVTSVTTGGTTNTLGNIQGLIAGNSYNVDVRAKIGTTWGSYSTRCSITLASAVAMDEIIEVQRSMEINDASTISDFNLYPNPTEVGGFVNLSFELPTSMEGNLISLDIIDISGKLIHSSKYNSNVGGNFLSVPVGTEFSSGIYFAKIMIGSEMKTIKFLVK